MGEMNSLSREVGIGCPECNDAFEIDDIPVSVTVEKFDVSRKEQDGVFDWTCENCGAILEIKAQLHIGVKVKSCAKI